MFWAILSIVFFTVSMVGILVFAKKIVDRNRILFTIMMIGIIAILSISIFTIGYFVPAKYEVREASYELVDFGKYPEYANLPGFSDKYVGIHRDGRYYCYFNERFHVCAENTKMVIDAERHEIIIKVKEPVLGFWSYQGYWGIPEIIEEIVYVPYGTLME